MGGTTAPGLSFEGRALLVAALAAGLTGPIPAGPVLAAAAGAVRAEPAQPAPVARELAGLPVVEVRVEGARTLTEETVLHYLGLSVGAPYDPAAVDRSLRRLWGRDLVEDVDVSAEPTTGGVRVLVSIVERSTLASIEYRGVERLRAAEIAERLARDRIRIGEGDPLRRGELRRLELAVTDLYRERGFPLARVETVIEPVAGGQVAVVVSVDEGDRLRIGELVFEGNTTFSDARLRRAVKRSKPSGPISRIMGRDRFDRAALDRDLERVREVYRRAGYKDAAVGEPQLRVVEGPDGRRLAVTVPIEEGDRWRLGGISFSGNRKLSDQRLLELFERPRSGWLESGFVERGVERVHDLYQRRGHLRARVEPVTVERAGRVADLMVRIDEGERYRVGQIRIEGNTDTRDKVIRRELAVQEGEVLDAVALRRSLVRLRQLEFFEVDENDPVRFDLREGEVEGEGRVDLTLKGREVDETGLFFGGGYSERFGLFGQFQYTSRNFLGRGETLRVSLELGADVRQAQAGYTVPWFLDRRQSVGAELFLREEELDLGGERLGQELSGGRLSWGRRLGLFQSLTLGYTYQDVFDRRFRIEDDGRLVAQELDREVSALRLSYLLDRVDGRFEPTRGVRVSGALEAAGGALGGDSRYGRLRAGLSLFRPLGRGRPRSVLGLNVEVGTIRPYGGTELSFNDRLYLGGPNSVRGFEPSSITARGVDGQRLTDGDGFLLGGDRSLEASLEYHLQLHRIVRLVLFADAGGVFAEGQSVDLSGLRTSAGLELRVTTPLLPQPLRFIWAENLDPLAADEFDSFQISFGASFP